MRARIRRKWKKYLAIAILAVLVYMAVVTVIVLGNPDMNIRALNSFEIIVLIPLVIILKVIETTINWLCVVGVLLVCTLPITGSIAIVYLARKRASQL